MDSQFNNNAVKFRDTFSYLPRVAFTTFEKPGVYDYIPESFKLRWEDPHKFIPIKMTESFNKKMFLNFIHRECFNSCISQNSSLTKSEKECYENCKSKNLLSLETFKEILLQRRNWRGFRNFISIKEYSRTPEEIGTEFPTDPMLRSAYLNRIEDAFVSKQKIALREVLNSKLEKDETLTVFDVYMQGKYDEKSNFAKEKKKGEREDIYNEFKELNEKYGDRVAELIKGKINMKDWKDVPGDDWVPEEESIIEELVNIDTPVDGDVATSDDS